MIYAVLFLTHNTETFSYLKKYAVSISRLILYEVVKLSEACPHDKKKLLLKAETIGITLENFKVIGVFIKVYLVSMGISTLHTHYDFLTEGHMLM